MRNIDKYDSVEEAIDSMQKYCDQMNCSKCKYNHVGEGLGCCALRWAADEANEKENK